MSERKLLVTEIVREQKDFEGNVFVEVKRDVCVVRQVSLDELLNKSWNHKLNVRVFVEVKEKVVKNEFE